MAGQPFKDGPAFLTTSVADVYVPSANTYALVRHIRIVNTNASARTVSIWLGATGGSANGTELIEGYSVAGNASALPVDLWYPEGLKLTASDFITGQAGTDSTSLVITVTGDLYAA
jgi:hypothetical protein